jgi:hypothetical protein
VFVVAFSDNVVNDIRATTGETAVADIVAVWTTA